MYVNCHIHLLNNKIQQTLLDKVGSRIPGKVANIVKNIMVNYKTSHKTVLFFVSSHTTTPKLVTVQSGLSGLI